MLAAAVVAGSVITLGSGGVVIESSAAQASTVTKASEYELDFHNAKTKGLSVRLKSALLVNYSDGSVLFAKNPDEVRPIASISKLMTAMVVLDKCSDLSLTEVVTKDDCYQSSRSRMRVGYKMSLNDLLYTSLMVSDNRATRALARAVFGSLEKCAEAMNAKAVELGLTNTRFVEPTGLSAANVSTATEVAKIIYYTRKYPQIGRITSIQNYLIKITSRKRTFKKSISNTNLLTHSPYDVLTGKTGYISASQYCVVSLVQNRQGERLTVVALGAPGAMTRFREARKLVDWGFKQI
jgi:D-alanyl-D-alanine endopeptidase (penicillin-binding protein 7)